MMRILVTEPEYFDGDAVSILESCGDVVAKRMGKDELAEKIADFDAIIVRIETHLDKKVLARAKRLRIIGSATTGLNHIDVDYAGERGIRIINLHGTHTIPTAEHTMALILSLSRKIPWAYRSVSEGKWERYRFIGEQLDGKTLGIIGIGRIGSKVAEYAKAFGMKIIAYDPYVKSSKDAKLVNLNSLLENSDIITLHAALTGESTSLICKHEFGLMKRNALLINTARAGLIDNAALIEALKDGKINGAAIDVFEDEPLSERDFLIVEYARNNSNLIITPHIGASTAEAAHEAGLEIAKGVAKALEKQ